MRGVWKRCIRIRGAAPNVPIIVLTGAYDQAAAIEALRAGAQDYVLKPPPDSATLHRILHYALHRQRLLQELDTAVGMARMAERQWRILRRKRERCSLTPPIARPRCSGSWSCSYPRLPIAPQSFSCRTRTPSHCSKWRTWTRLAARKYGSKTHELLASPAARARLDMLSESNAMSSSLLDEARQIVLDSFSVAARATTVPLHFGGRFRGFLLMVARTDRSDAAVDDEFARSLPQIVSHSRSNRAISSGRHNFSPRRATAPSGSSRTISADFFSNTIEICAEALLDPDPPPESGVRNMAELIGTLGQLDESHRRRSTRQDESRNGICSRSTGIPPTCPSS